MGGFNASGQIVTEMNFLSSGAGAVINVGHSTYTGVTVTDASLTAAVGAVTDIDDPAGTGGWTDLFSITAQKCRVRCLGDPIAIYVNSAEDAGDALRCQVVVDGTVAADATVTRNAVSSYAQVYALDDAVQRYDAEESFVIRIARIGTFTNAGSKFITSNIFYEYLE